MLFRFCLYGFLKNQRYFEPFLMLAFLDRGLSFLVIGLLLAARDFTVNLIEVPSGAMADSFGRRRSMMISFVAYIGSFAILGSFDQLTWLFLGMVLYGIGDTFRTGTHKAMIFEWLRIHGRTDEKTSVYGFTRSWSQIGSAVSGLIAAGFILWTGNYRYVFYFSILPYALNLINFLGYPAQLDGEHEKARTIAQSFLRLRASLRKSLTNRKLRGLMVESICWEGYFAAIKDYLQPILQSAALVLFVKSLALDSTFWSSDARRTAILIGPVYALLFLLSAWSSRQAHKLANQSGGESQAAQWIWGTTAFTYCALLGFGLANQIGLVIVAFILLYVLKNVWRPILVSRFDEIAESQEGATILSIESQSQRAGTFVMAPIIGWMIDTLSSNDGPIVVWPIGIVGSLLAMLMYASHRSTAAVQNG